MFPPSRPIIYFYLLPLISFYSLYIINRYESKCLQQQKSVIIAGVKCGPGRFAADKTMMEKVPGREKF